MIPMPTRAANGSIEFPGGNEAGEWGLVVGWSTVGEPTEKPVVPRVPSASLRFEVFF